MHWICTHGYFSPLPCFRNDTNLNKAHHTFRPPLSDPQVQLKSIVAQIQPGDYKPFLNRLAHIFKAIDENYQAATDHYGFSCSGCTDNCCKTHFYHHTILEYLYLLEGVRQLDAQNRAVIQKRAQVVGRRAAAADVTGRAIHLMCPLNFEGLCSLYIRRPMICRLHGLAYELQNPAQAVVHGRGCDAFVQQCREKDYYPLDRTSFYGQVAALEKDFRQAIDVAAKFKLTVAQMLI